MLQEQTALGLSGAYDTLGLQYSASLRSAVEFQFPKQGSSLDTLPWSRSERNLERKGGPDPVLTRWRKNLIRKPQLATIHLEHAPVARSRLRIAWTRDSSED